MQPTVDGKDKQHSVFFITASPFPNSNVEDLAAQPEDRSSTPVSCNLADHARMVSPQVPYKCHALLDAKVPPIKPPEPKGSREQLQRSEHHRGATATGGKGERQDLTQPEAQSVA